MADKQTPHEEQTEQFTPEVQAMIDAAEKDGFRPAAAFDKRAFVDWDETPSITGMVGKAKDIPSKFGNDKQTIIPVGNLMVNASGMLSELPVLEGRTVTIICTGSAVTGSGLTYKTFKVLVK